MKQFSLPYQSNRQRMIQVYELSSVKILTERKSTKAQDAVASRTIEALRNKYERSLNYNFKRVFKKIGQNLSVLSIDADETDIWKAIHAEDAWQYNILDTVYTSMSDDVWPLIADNTLLKSMQFKKEPPIYKLNVREWIRKNAGQHIKYIDSTTLSDIRMTMETSGTTAEFRSGIEQYFTLSTPNRAYTIARTESAAASEVSGNISAKTYDTGREKVKRWRTIGDPEVRDQHQMMNNVVVGFDEMFKVPSKYGFDLLEYPLDSSHGATAGNIVNCRCHTAYEYKK